MLKKLKHVKLLTSAFLLATILNGCSKTIVKTVKVDSFCNGRYEALQLEKADEVNLNTMRSNKKYILTIDKFIDHVTIHEKELKACPEIIEEKL
tara:strand:- start:973 stop:1254 length:282 start_codon:yes stop_codon:yes gene_type:complete